MKRFLVASFVILSSASIFAQHYNCPAPVGMPPQGEGWVALFDGDPSDLDDWREAIDEPDGAWKVVDGILTHENTSKGNHLFYDGDEGPWGDLELVCEFRTEVGTNSGVYFRSAYTAEGFPQPPHDLEAQINNTSNATQGRRTGNLIPRGVEGCDASVCDSPTQDNEWTHMRVLVQTVGGDLHITITVNGVVIKGKDQVEDYQAINATSYLEPGTICLQGEGLGSTFDRIEFRSVYVRHLPVASCGGPDESSPSPPAPLPLGNRASIEGLDSASHTIAHYHFDGDYANSVARNGRFTSTGNTSLSSENLSWMATPQGTAVKFTGKGDHLFCGLMEDDLYPSNTSEITIEALFKVDFIKNQGEPNQELLKIFTGDSRFWELRMTTWDTAPSLVYNNEVIAGPSDFEAFSESWENLDWFHFRITYESSGRARAYINDQLLGEAIIDVPHTEFEHWAFRLGDFQGYVDEFKVSNTVYDSGGTIPLPFETWRTHFFSAAELGDPSKETTIWGDNADADGDGFTTLAEYYLGLNPTLADGLSAFEGTPDSSPVVMHYYRAKQATDIDFEILGSMDLNAWSGESVTSPMMTPGLLFDRMQVELSNDYSALPRKFFSVGVTRSLGVAP